MDGRLSQHLQIKIPSKPSLEGSNPSQSLCSKIKNIQLGMIVVTFNSDPRTTITLGNNSLISKCCLDFYKGFRVFLHCWIRKWHPFLPIRSGFCAKLIWKKSDLVTKSLTFFWHYQLIFVNTYHPKYVFKRTMFCQHHILITRSKHRLLQTEWWELIKVGTRKLHITSPLFKLHGVKFSFFELLECSAAGRSLFRFQL